jgi:hypothetical protein
MLEPTHFAMLQKHLKKHMMVGAISCPICGSKEWTAEAGTLLGTVVQPGGVFMAGSSNQVPLAILICNTCYFVRQFALVPVIKANVDV